jgi:toluene methyl-monooxygenase
MFDYLRYYLGPLCVAIGISGFILGNNYLWLGFATYFVVAVFDILLPRDLANRSIDNEFLAELPLYIHVGLMITLYGAFTWRAAFDGGAWQWSSVQMLGATASLTWLSAVPNLPIQHELLHHRDRFSRACAFLLGALYGDPVRGLPHLHGHHIHLGTPQDHDTARRGETMYTFPFRATWGSYSDAWRVESQRLEKYAKNKWTLANRCLQAIALEVIILGIIGIAAGAMAMLIALLAIGGAKLLIEAFNYYQHYGLLRVPGTQYDRRHLWNHLQPIARAMAVEITNHSDHHMDGYKPFYKLQPDVAGPQMPSVFLCFMLGLVPPLWFRWVAQPRLKEWDLRFATPDERKLARDANALAGWPDWQATPEPAALAQAS